MVARTDNKDLIVNKARTVPVDQIGSQIKIARDQIGRIRSKVDRKVDGRIKGRDKDNKVPVRINGRINARVSDNQKLVDKRHKEIVHHNQEDKDHRRELGRNLVKVRKINNVQGSRFPVAVQLNFKPGT